MEEHCFHTVVASNSKECRIKVKVNARFRHIIIFFFPDNILFIILPLCLHFIQPTDFHSGCCCSANGSAKFRGSTVSSALVKSYKLFGLKRLTQTHNRQMYLPRSVFVCSIFSYCNLQSQYPLLQQARQE